MPERSSLSKNEPMGTSRARDISWRVVRKGRLLLFSGYEGRLLTEEEVDFILDRFVLGAKMAHDCGADGVDFKLCHGYFGSQLLRPFNDRKWKCGGSWANRTRFAYEGYERIAKEINDPNFIVGSKISA